MALHQQPCNGQKAHDRVVIQEMILREDDLLTMPPEGVNAILVTLNEGRTLEEAARLSNEFLGMLGQIRSAFIYSTTVTDDGGLREAICPIERCVAMKRWICSFVWLIIVGAAPAADEQELPRSPIDALPLLDKLLRTPRTQGDGDAPPPMVAVIIERAELIVPDADLATMSLEDRMALATIAKWGTDAEIEKAGNPVILVVGTLADLHKELRAARNKFEAIEVPLPDFDARRRYIERYMNERGQFVLDDGLTIEAVANTTAGLSLVQVEDILLRAEGASVLTSNLIWDRKQSIIKAEFGDVLEILDPRFGFDDIGGFEYIKEFFLRNVIRPIREGRKSRVPMGVLMTGPAGTGKSIMAEAVAKEAGVNAVRLRIGGQIASKWQGEGERNLEKALRAIVGLAPTIVFIDEIDQAMKRGGDGDSNQQDQRIFQRLLEFMADTSHRGEIVLLATTNRPDLMDAALRRPGRFDKKIPFLISDRDERGTIFKVMARRYLGREVGAPDEVLDSTEG